MKDSDNKKMPLAETAAEFADGGRISFHVPGHKGNEKESGELGWFFGKKVLSRDLTELPGLDDLHNADGVIKEAEERAAELFGADQTFFLANGTTSGIAAAIAAVSGEKNKVIMERCSHGCTTSGLIISGSSPYYIYDAYDAEAHIAGGISADEVKKALVMCENPSAVLLTHPSYYGVYSDLREIVDAAHGSGVPVIVDEAHGAQMMFTGQGIPSAMEAGADISVQSTHKMLGSLTESSMLHIQGDLVDRRRLKFFISLMTSSSPSYLLMSSLDAVRYDMGSRGHETWQKLNRMIKEAADRIDNIKGIKCCRSFTGADGRRHDTEGSRLLVTARGLGLSGRELESLLADDYRIDAEFSDLLYTVLLAGTGSNESDLEVLVSALEDISQRFAGKSAEESALRDRLEMYDRFFSLTWSAELTPRAAVYADQAVLAPEAAEGRVSSSDISVYPPGIPAVRAGEVLTRDIIGYIIDCAKLGFEFHGLAEYDESGAVKFFCAEDERDSMILGGYF
ncbi:MAG: aminotransferase class I/II-fold pyridoxal phosphate-dependent enzyme [Anaerovoracaceae bacterium]|nr:aminotransferase class I/II-fold pyridoxal phosphate-dependent enzyme [Bacillota bacterium]MDY2670097.1 aminotransferase class I/II-fold pyridoxal phosphate-dependent enzyme [Anaerovoracaceae bacterium]